MKHCGLPWELGLLEVHKVLLDNGLRESVTLRVDGGLSNGEDLLKAILLGAQEFEFGKLLLIAEGCVMARICEKILAPLELLLMTQNSNRNTKVIPKKLSGY